MFLTFKLIKTYLRKVLLFWTLFTSSSNCWIRLRTYMCCCNRTPNQSSSQRTVTLRSSATSIWTCTQGTSNMLISKSTHSSVLLTLQTSSKMGTSFVHYPITEPQSVILSVQIYKTNLIILKALLLNYHFHNNFRGFVFRWLFLGGEGSGYNTNLF